VAEQQETFAGVRSYTAQVREVVEILTVEEGMSLADREPLFVAKTAELQSFADDKTYNAMAKMMTSFQVGLFAGAELTDYPHGDLHHQKRVLPEATGLFRDFAAMVFSLLARFPA